VIHLQRYLAALLVLVGAFGLYAATIAPWIAPPPIARRNDSSPHPPPEPSKPVQEQLVRLFPPTA